MQDCGPSRVMNMSVHKHWKIYGFDTLTCCDMVDDGFVREGIILVYDNLATLGCHSDSGGERLVLRKFVEVFYQGIHV